MKDSDIPLVGAVRETFDALFDAIKKAEDAGLKTYIHVDDGPGGEASEDAYVEVSRVYRAGK